ncbi:MAG TPA: hypothetical protein VK978_03730 [Candidatus Saccharimonadales bacterium]|nr:hypothetical protein [Candidatus Saccharimonadales bacterium]
MKRFRRDRVRIFSNFQPLFRAITVIASVAGLVTGVTYAALQSQQAVLTGNSIQSATADLRISGSGATYGTTATGFKFAEVIPGAVATGPADDIFYLKNYGKPALDLKVAISSVPVNDSNVDLNKTYLVLTRQDTNSSQKLSIASLIAAHTTGGTALTDNLAGGLAVQYKAQVAMDADAFTGQKADITGIDIVFSGTAVIQ